MVEERWHDFAKEKPSEDMEGRDFIVSNGYSDTISMWCGGYWENEPFMGNRLCDEVVRWKFYFTPEEEKANEQTCNELKMSKIENNIEEVTEPQIFNPPKKMFTWSYREGKPCYVCEREVVAILPQLPNHANVVCLNGNSLWWATHCGIIKESTDEVR